MQQKHVQCLCMLPMRAKTWLEKSWMEKAEEAEEPADQTQAAEAGNPPFHAVANGAQPSRDVAECTGQKDLY